jgi:carbonic anhydrase
MNRLATLSLAVLLLTPLAAPGGEHAATPAAPSPDAVLKQLQAGNARFAAGTSAHPDGSVARRKGLTQGQHPKAVIFGCADSRVPPELIFDEGLGDLFVVRVAGNVADPVDVGSVEYAAEHLGTRLVVVLGHHGCGAVKATAEAHGKADGNLGAIMAEIAPAVEQARANPGREGLVNDAVHFNARRVAGELKNRSPVLAKLLEEDKLKVVVGVYDLDSGKVDFE